MNESLTALTLTLPADPRLATLFGLLTWAAVIDVRQKRIPNWLCLSGTAVGLFISLLQPLTMEHGLLWSLQGLLAGLAIMLPLWLIRAMGAGDAKLAAMTGVFLGSGDVLYACLASFIAAGALTLLWCLLRREHHCLAHNLRAGVTLTTASLMTQQKLGLPVPPSLGRLPFALSFALGTMAWVALGHYGVSS